MRLTNAATLLAAALLSACGGDDTGNPPANNPPSFGVTRIDVNFAENGTGPVTTLVITDEDLPFLGLQVGGPDGSLFQVNADRTVRFRSPPDFEAPRDQGANNVYNLTVTAIDTTGASAVVEINVTVTNDATAMVRFVDPMFATTTSLGSVPVAGTTFQLGLIGPAGDSMAGRPLLLLAPGGGAAATPIITDGFARRGYVVGVISGEAGDAASSAAALGAAVEMIASPAFDARGFGIDAGALFVAGEGTVAARAAGALAVGAHTPGPVRGALALGGGLFDPGRAGGTSALLFASGEARQGAVLAAAYRGSGVAMQFLETGAGALSATDRQAAIAGAAQLFHAPILARRGL